MKEMDSCFHHFGQSVEGIALPARFTYPFHYVPHPLCVMAAAEVQTYLQQREDWKDELEQVKEELEKCKKRSSYL